MTLLRLSNIADYLTYEKSLDNAIQFVAMNVCSSGRVAQIYLARLHNDFSFTHISSFGFGNRNNANLRDFDRAEFDLMSKAIHSKEVIIRSNFVGAEQLTPGEFIWKTSIHIPLLPNFAASINTQIAISDSQENRNYFMALRSVLNLYLQNWDARENDYAQRSRKTKASKVGSNLTERQELILSMIKAGMTNNSIAARMGYSESLIRQESMAIYQKLGINGRRELKDLAN